MAVFEILEMDPTVEKVILADPVEEKVYAAARARGMITMREDGIIKAAVAVLDSHIEINPVIKTKANKIALTPPFCAYLIINFAPR